MNVLTYSNSLLGMHCGQRRGAITRAVQTADSSSFAAAAPAAESTSSCPFSKVKSQLEAMQALGRSSTVALPPLQGTVIFPGPHPLSFDSLRDVSLIFTSGLHAAMLAFSDRYGPICRFANPVALGGASSWVFLNSPQNIQHVCAINTKNYNRRFLPDIYKFVTHEKGILGSQDDYNAKHRKLCAPPFRNKTQLQRFSDVVVKRSALLADIWHQQLQQRGDFVTDVATCTQRLTLDVVGLTAFSHDFGQTFQIQKDLEGRMGGAGSSDRILWAVNTFGEVLAEVFITPLPILKVMDKLGFPQLKTLAAAVSTMRESMLGVIAKRRQDLAAGCPLPDDLLNALLQSHDDAGHPMTDEELWEDVHDVMGAGHETTATTTAALLYCISAHPQVEARVHAELDRVLGDRPPTFSDIQQLQYLSQCLKETLRLYPAIPVFPREAAAADVLPSGHPISAGDVVFMSSYSLGRSKDVWEDPLEFRPARFSPEAEEKMDRFAWLPFGAGPRMCLGANFAMMSVTLMAASLLQQFKFKPVLPTSPLIPVAYDITMNYQPTNGLHMEVSRRREGPNSRVISD